MCAAMSGYLKAINCRLSARVANVELGSGTRTAPHLTLYRPAWSWNRFHRPSRSPSSPPAPFQRPPSAPTAPDVVQLSSPGVHINDATAAKPTFHPPSDHGHHPDQHPPRQIRAPTNRAPTIPTMPPSAGQLQKLPAEKSNLPSRRLSCDR